jgi:SPP1 family predicted phage head-tail adaptor
MLAAQLSEKITIQRSTVSKDGLGSPTTAWSDLRTVWARVIDNSGTKAYDSDPSIRLNLSTMTFEFRHLIGFGYDCRIIYSGEVYEVQHIIPLRRKEGFKVLTERRQNNG